MGIILNVLEKYRSLYANIKKCNGGGGSLKTFCNKRFSDFCEKFNISLFNFIRLNKTQTVRQAFTLAEVLITLGIIGVVAAMTIPTLMNRTNDKELVSGTLKMGTMLSNALKNMEAIEGTGVNKLEFAEFKEKYKEYLKTVRCTDHDVCLAD